MIITKEHREAAKQSKPRKEMTEKQGEHLRQVNLEEKLSRAADERFATAVPQVSPTPENLAKLIERCSGDPQHLDRRTNKLLYWIQSRGWRLGHEIKRPSDIVLLSNLAPDEGRMSDSAFAGEWAVKKVVPPKIDEPEPRYCALGKKCLRFANRRPGVVAGRSPYCSQNCRGRAKIIKTRLSNVGVIPELGFSPAETRINAV